MPIDCPECGRARLMALPATRTIWCEKCHASKFTCDASEHEEGGPHSQWAIRFTEYKDIGKEASE